MPDVPSKSKVKEDARGAMAPSQGDPNNDGADSAEPRALSKDGDATRKKDDHSSPKTPETGAKPRPSDA